MIASGSECKMLLADLEIGEASRSDCLQNSPAGGQKCLEHLGPGNRDRSGVSWLREHDYQQKREEYLVFGVREYWIFDAEKEEMLVLRRSGGRWIERGPAARNIQNAAPAWP